MGSPVRWHFIADLAHEGHGDPRVADLARVLLGGAVNVQVIRNPEGIVVCPGAKIVGVSRAGHGDEGRVDWHGYVGRLDVTAEGTRPTPSAVNPFSPRRRVLRARNMKVLVDQFRHIAEPVMGVKNELQNLTFPDGQKTTIIQDGMSDWSFFGHILDQARFMARNADWLPLSLFGGVDEGAGTAGKWVVTPGIKTPYARWNEIEPRTINFVEANDGPERFQFGSIDGGSRVPAFPSARFPTVGISRPWRTFGEASWHQWRNLDLPRFTTKGDMIWQIHDRISLSEQDDIGWETVVYAAPPEAQMIGPFTPRSLSPWIGIGEVSETDPKGPWIRVKLAGFEDGDASLADVRLSTPFSGTDGKKGLHFVPEQRTRVEVCWTGRFDSSVVLVGNTRWEPADFSSPSVFLEATHTAQYEDINVKKAGEITVDSNLSVTVKKSTSVKSQQPLKIHADNADLKMTGGIVYTGRGL